MSGQRLLDKLAEMTREEYSEFMLTFDSQVAIDYYCGNVCVHRNRCDEDFQCPVADFYCVDYMLDMPYEQVMEIMRKGSR